MPTYFLAFDIPKLIVNGPIQGQGFETADATQKMLPVAIGNPFSDESLTLFEGFELDRIGALIALSLAFLGYVIINVAAYIIDKYGIKIIMLNLSGNAGE